MWHLCASKTIRIIVIVLYHTVFSLGHLSCFDTPRLIECLLQDRKPHKIFIAQEQCVYDNSKIAVTPRSFIVWLNIFFNELTHATLIQQHKLSNLHCSPFLVWFKECHMMYSNLPLHWLEWDWVSQEISIPLLWMELQSFNQNISNSHRKFSCMPEVP